MSKQHTKLEKAFARRVVKYCETHPGITPHLICYSFGYNNSAKINEFLSGSGTISSRTMGKIDEYMKKNK